MLEVGSASWSLFVASYILAVHEGGAAELGVFRENQVERMLDQLSQLCDGYLPFQLEIERSDFDAVLDLGYLKSITASKKEEKTEEDENAFSSTESGERFYFAEPSRHQMNTRGKKAKADAPKQ